MKRYLLYALVLLSVMTIVFYSPANAGDDHPDQKLHRIDVYNRTGDPVIIDLYGINVPAVYHLSVTPGGNQAFTVQDGEYEQVSSACGASAAGVLQVTRQLKLVFTPCSGRAPNPGAPSIEKIHLTDSPQGIAWFYQYGRSHAPGSTFVPGGSGSGACQLTARGEVTIYRRPSTAADVFSVQPAGFTQTFSARTSNGWLGFDPGVAQAANIGVFRLRWVAPNTQTLTGGCNRLPVVWGPPPGICFDMPMQITTVYAAPDTSSAVLATLQVGDFAAITGLNPGGDWAYVDLGKGNTGSTVEGWVDSGSLNVSGPCDSQPTITP